MHLNWKKKQMASLWIHIAVVQKCTSQTFSLCLLYKNFKRKINLICSSMFILSIRNLYLRIQGSHHSNVMYPDTLHEIRKINHASHKPEKRRSTLRQLWQIQARLQYLQKIYNSTHFWDINSCILQVCRSVCSRQLCIFNNFSDLAWIYADNRVCGNNLLINSLVVFLFLFLLHIHLARVWELVQQHILAAAEAKLEDIFFFELIVTLGLNPLIVQVGAVPRSKVNNVRPHPAASGAVSSSILYQSAKHRTAYHVHSSLKLNRSQ